MSSVAEKEKFLVWRTRPAITQHICSGGEGCARLPNAIKGLHSLTWKPHTCPIYYNSVIPLNVAVAQLSFYVLTNSHSPGQLECKLRFPNHDGMFKKLAAGGALLSTAGWLLFLVFNNFFFFFFF
ncbi:hypothetical protein GDO78_004817 [Eleutherodactylus coqui]|uniref:Uncharacterized protein n=1 Tax=Eleutherodactylus coqui TaxID=57060 RepID=A0A8J6FIQ3_ELECQ|nr:hypothetical protein GDO78_004817 [Eleutherodactylus coqui]